MDTLEEKPIKPAAYELKIIVNDDSDVSNDKMPTYNIECKMDDAFHPIQLLVLHKVLEQQQKNIMDMWDDIVFKDA